MKEKSKIDLHLRINDDKCKYDIVYYDVNDYNYTKLIAKTTEHPEVKGFGHYVTEQLSVNTNGELRYITVSHNEEKSSDLGTVHSVEEMTREEHLRCSYLITEMNNLIMNGSVLKVSRDKQEANLARIVYDDISTNYFLTKSSEIKGLKRTF